MKITTLTIAICAASCALAGTALAGGHPNDRAGLQGVGAASAIHADDAVRPDDRAGPLGIARAEAISGPSARPDGRQAPDAADIVASQPTLVLVDRDGFDWGDAGVGAFGALGAGLLALSLGFGAMWIRRRDHEAAM